MSHSMLRPPWSSIRKRFPSAISTKDKPIPCPSSTLCSPSQAPLPLFAIVPLSVFPSKMKSNARNQGRAGNCGRKVEVPPKPINGTGSCWLWSTSTRTRAATRNCESHRSSSTTIPSTASVSLGPRIPSMAGPNVRSLSASIFSPPILATPKESKASLSDYVRKRRRSCRNFPTLLRTISQRSAMPRSNFFATMEQKGSWPTMSLM